MTNQTAKFDQKTLSDFINIPSKIKGVKKIIAIASAKGGVGKSTIACNLAIACQLSGINTALVDADIYGPSVANLMKLKNKPELINNLFIPIISNDVKCISLGNMIDDNQAGIWRGPMITKILSQLITAVNWNYDDQEVDLMIIDMPPGTGDVYLTIAQRFPLAGVILISTPQTVAVIDTVKSVDCFQKLKIPIIGIIQNMSFYQIGDQKKYLFGKDNAKEMAKKFDLNFLGEIAIHEEISQANELQQSFVINNSNIDATKLLIEIAKKL
jgi:ATP-binding protein involved in chromosome partitioning